MLKNKTDQLPTNYRPTTDQVPIKYPSSKSLKNIFKQTHGGKRLNAGSKPKYNEPTKTTAFRIPTSKIDEVKKLVRDFLAGYERENNQ